MWAVLADNYVNPYRNLSGHGVCAGDVTIADL